MAQNTPHRIRFNFWLNLDKPDESEIADKIELLKNERSFTSTIRDGIRLIVDLRKGNTDVLFELFPLMKAKLQGRAGDGNLKREIDRLEQLILQQSNQPVMKSVSGGLSPIGGTKPLPPPAFDNDLDMSLTVNKAQGNGQAAQNFLQSMQTLQQ